MTFALNCLQNNVLVLFFKAHRCILKENIEEIFPTKHTYTISVVVSTRTMEIDAYCHSIIPPEKSYNTISYAFKKEHLGVFLPQVVHENKIQIIILTLDAFISRILIKNFGD